MPRVKQTYLGLVNQAFQALFEQQCNNIDTVSAIKLDKLASRTVIGCQKVDK